MPTRFPAMSRRAHVASRVRRWIVVLVLLLLGTLWLVRDRFLSDREVNVARPTSPEPGVSGTGGTRPPPREGDPAFTPSLELSNRPTTGTDMRFSGNEGDRRVEPVALDLPLPAVPVPEPEEEEEEEEDDDSAVLAALPPPDPGAVAAPARAAVEQLRPQGPSAPPGVQNNQRTGLLEALATIAGLRAITAGRSSQSCGETVTVCHRGSVGPAKATTISVCGLSEHMNHGDTVGQCATSPSR